MQSSVLTWFCLIWSTACCAGAFWAWGSVSTRRRKPPPSLEPPPSSGQLARLEADQLELSSALEKINTTMKRLSSRQGMRDLRERQAEDQDTAPPVGAPKVELLRHYGMAGKVGPEFAKAQMARERGSN